MAIAIVNTHRFDNKNFKFRVSIDGKPVAVVNEATGLSPEPGTPKKRSGKKIPGLHKFGNITLKHGMLTDIKFLDWVTLVTGKSEAEAKNLRKNIILEYCNEAGEVIASYRLINGWVTKLESPDLQAKGNGITIESIELSYEALELVNR